MPEKKRKSELIELLRKVCERLTYISETDAAIVPYLGGKVREMSAELLLRDIGRQQEKHIEEVPFEIFFDKLTAAREWHHAEDRRRTGQFKKLRRALEQNLTKIRVLRIGKIRIEIYIVGIEAGGNLAGVKTEAVET